MKYIRTTLLILLALYSLYLLKTALGINISSRYHAADIFKLPLRTLMHGVREFRS